MKIKGYKEFLENAESSGVSGMGAVTSAQPGSLPGTTGTEGSGDIGFTFKKERRKKGDPSEVTDLRDLEETNDITKVDDIKESITLRKRDPRYDDEVVSTIEECLYELQDMGFELSNIGYEKDRMSMDLDDEETGYFDDEELRISLHKMVNEKWIGNIQSKIKFDKEKITEKSTPTMRGTSITDSEKKVSDTCEVAALRLINLLDYESGFINIYWEVAGAASPFNEPRNININIHFTLKNIIKY